MHPWSSRRFTLVSGHFSAWLAALGLLPQIPVAARLATDAPSQRSRSICSHADFREAAPAADEQEAAATPTAAVTPDSTCRHPPESKPSSNCIRSAVAGRSGEFAQPVDVALSGCRAAQGVVAP